MAIDIFNIQPNIIDPSIKGKIFWFYGEPGTRKTTVAAHFPSPLLLATEYGYKFINGVKAANLTNWNDMRQIYRQLKTEEAQQMYKTIVFDRADTLYDYCKEYIIKMWNSNLKSGEPIRDLNETPYSSGYSMARKEFNSVIKGLESLGYGLVFITHDKVDMEKITKQDLENNAAKVLRGYTDFIFLLRKEKIDNKDTVIAYSQMVGADSKSRVRYFTPKFEFNYENLEKELKLAIDKQIQMEGIKVAVQEKQKTEERGLEEIKTSVINLAQNLQKTPKWEGVVNTITTIMQGTPISKAEEEHREKLLILETYLIGIED